ncbi:MAG: SDR family NAD(P)-dependent oxidoreductase [Pseudomonadota bacterium]
MFHGKTALVTGATSGIGRATARAFAKSGAKVMLTGRNESRGQDVLAECGEDAGFLAGNVTDSSFASQLVSQTVERFGSLDILVNNAGIDVGLDAPQTTDEQWLDVMATNLDAVFYFCRAGVRQMRRQGTGGAIVNIGSDWSLVAGKQAVAYCASKGGVLMLSKSMALDHARENIRVNVVCPAEIDTPMIDETAKAHGKDVAEARAAFAEAIPMGRIGEPEDVAAAVLFLASDAARFITGTALSVDGGTTAQ